MRLSKRRGQALVEFALVLPLLLALLVGIVDISYLYNHQLTLTNASREGARMATLGSSGTQTRASVKSYLSASGYTPLPADADIVVTFADGEVTVAITHQVPWLFAMSGSDLTLAATTRMRVE